MVLFPNKTTTMKQKIVVKVNMNDLKSRSKALKIASGLLGVESVSLKGYDKTQLEIIGDGMIDVAQLTSMLRESLGYAEPVSVNSAGDGGEKKEAETKIDAGEPKPDEILCLEMEMGKQELQERGVHSPPLNLPLLDIGMQELQESVSESESESFNAHPLETNMQELHESKIGSDRVVSSENSFPISGKNGSGVFRFRIKTSWTNSDTYFRSTIKKVRNFLSHNQHSSRASISSSRSSLLCLQASIRFIRHGNILRGHHYMHHGAKLQGRQGTSRLQMGKQVALVLSFVSESPTIRYRPRNDRINFRNIANCFINRCLHFVPHTC